MFTCSLLTKSFIYLFCVFNFSDEASIEVSDVNGGFRKTLFDTGLQMPRGIAVAPAKRFVLLLLS